MSAYPPPGGGREGDPPLTVKAYCFAPLDEFAHAPRRGATNPKIIWGAALTGRVKG
jgi:hypothetical protein